MYVRAINSIPGLKYVDSGWSNDLLDIPTHYIQKKGGDFWVATAGGRIVGHIGLREVNLQIQDEGRLFLEALRAGEVRGQTAPAMGAGRTAEIVRFGMEPKMAGQGIGRKLLSVMMRIANEMEYQTLVLRTSTLQKPAMKLIVEQKFVEYQRAYEDWLPPDERVVRYYKSLKTDKK
jgi:GNAT superfamily N-acetyltransferase